MINDIAYAILFSGFLIVSIVAVVSVQFMKRLHKEKIVNTKRGTYTFTPTGGHT